MNSSSSSVDSSSKAGQSSSWKSAIALGASAKNAALSFSGVLSQLSSSLSSSLSQKPSSQSQASFSSNGSQASSSKDQSLTSSSASLRSAQESDFSASARRAADDASNRKANDSGSQDDSQSQDGEEDDDKGGSSPRKAVIDADFNLLQALDASSLQNPVQIPAPAEAAPESLDMELAPVDVQAADPIVQPQAFAAQAPVVPEAPAAAGNAAASAPSSPSPLPSFDASAPAKSPVDASAQPQALPNDLAAAAVSDGAKASGKASNSPAAASAAAGASQSAQAAVASAAAGSKEILKAPAPQIQAQNTVQQTPAAPLPSEQASSQQVQQGISQALPESSLKESSQGQGASSSSGSIDASSLTQALPSSAKALSVSYDSSSSQGQSQFQSGSGGQDVLKDLLNRQSNYAAAASKLQASTQFKVQSASFSAAAPAVQSVSSASASVSLDASAAKSAAVKEGNSFDSFIEGLGGKSAGQQNPLFGLASSSPASSTLMAAKSGNLGASLSTGVELANSIQEIVARMPSALRGSNLDGKASFSMDVAFDGLGQLKLSIERSGDRISVNLQTGSESAKDQLSGQRQDIEREMKNLGYREVNVDIGYGSAGRDSSNEEWRRSGSGKGNADSEENVKLSGDANADLAEILAMR